MRFNIFINLCLTMSLFSCGQGKPQIHAIEVEETIKFLASDEMKGRKAFSPEIENAADFIYSKFEQIGLEPLEGLDSYYQKFSIIHLKPDSIATILNNINIPAGNLAVRVWTGIYELNTPDEITILKIKEEDDAFRIFNQVRNSSQDHLVLVHPSHKAFFGRIKRFFDRGTRSFSPQQQAAQIYILTDQQEVASLKLHVTSNVQEKTLSNVVGKIEGNRSNEIVLFSAHYDHIGVQAPVNGDSIANGANDNASGTTAVIMLAKYFKSLPRPERTLMFVAFTAEEIGGYGSRFFSQQLDPDKVVAMFNIEMIGKPAVEGPNTAWITGFEKSDFGKILQKAVKDTPYTFYADPYPDQNLFYRSDNATLARRGVPAHTISTTPIDVDKDYHQVSDEVQTLDLQHLTNTIQAIAAGARLIISGQETPARIGSNE